MILLGFIALILLALYITTYIRLASIRTRLKQHKEFMKENYAKNKTSSYTARTIAFHIDKLLEE